MTILSTDFYKKLTIKLELYKSFSALCLTEDKQFTELSILN